MCTGPNLYYQWLNNNQFHFQGNGVKDNSIYESACMFKRCVKLFYWYAIFVSLTMADWTTSANWHLNVWQKACYKLLMYQFVPLTHLPYANRLSFSWSPNVSHKRNETFTPSTTSHERSNTCKQIRHMHIINKKSKMYHGSYYKICTHYHCRSSAADN